MPFFQEQRGFWDVESVIMWLILIFDRKNMKSFGKGDSWRKLMFNEYLPCANWCNKCSPWEISFKSHNDPKMLVCWKQDTLQCHSLPHPNAHLCHYQNKETFASFLRLPLMLLVMTRDFFHRGVCSTVTRKWVLSFWKKMYYINCLLYSYLVGSRVLELVSEFM